MASTAIERLIDAVGYPERAPRGALSFTLQVDGVDVLAEERGGEEERTQPELYMIRP